MRVFLIGIKHPFDMTIQRSRHAYPGGHRGAVEGRDQDQLQFAACDFSCCCSQLLDLGQRPQKDRDGHQCHAQRGGKAVIRFY
jgi:hypothetical protein